MKNKRAIKYSLIPIGYLVISMMITKFGNFILLKIRKHIIMDHMYGWQRTLLVNPIDNLRESFSDVVWMGINLNQWVIIGIIILIYVFITRKKFRRLANVFEATEKMKNGELDKPLEIKGEDDIAKLAGNINGIVEKLKEITLEEKKAQKTKNDLITNVSHDLRTPLTSIIGYLNLIETDEYRDEVQLRHYTCIAYEKAKRLNVLINDLFELTKMQNGVVVLRTSKVNLVELLGQIVSDFQYQIKCNEMESRVRFSDDKLVVNGDSDKLVRAFENLITNSIKYGKEGYYIDIVTKKIGNFALVQVINYGEEILEEDIKYIFDRFYRVDKSRNSEEGGSGLGLSITKNIIELHKGTISALSDSEKTVFEIKLPIIV